MDNKTVLCAKKLLEELNQLKEEGFIFRGHSSSAYILQPQAFRLNDIKKISRFYPVQKKLLINGNKGKH